MTSRRRVLIVQPSFQGPGGGNAVAAWMLAALSGRHQLGTLSWSELDINEMNRMHGTSVNHDDLLVESLPAWIRVAGDTVPLPIGAVKYAVLLRRAKQLASRYDLCVSACNEADFGTPGIQYVHYPFYQRPRPLAEQRWLHRLPVLPLYYWCVERLAQFSMARMKQNVTLANSDWTRGLLQRLHGIEARTLYPPVNVQFPDVHWSARVNGFLCVGRLSPEKNLDRVIDIVAGVRQHAPDVTLCLAGTPGPKKYCDHIRQRVSAAGGWVSVRENLSHQELRALIPIYRYGIHGMPIEPFGMAPAEMAAAGCIVFVPNDGGQIEIVNSDPRLVYHATSDAIDRIIRILENPVEQHAVRNVLMSRAQMFAVERFVSAFREIVDQALNAA
jgi:glycosyltransferase involved in cell wall biosynthesis